MPGDRLRASRKRLDHGSQYTVVDPYALVLYGWDMRGGFPMKELNAYTAGTHDEPPDGEENYRRRGERFDIIGLLRSDYES